MKQQLFALALSCFALVGTAVAQNAQITTAPPTAAGVVVLDCTDDVTNAGFTTNMPPIAIPFPCTALQKAQLILAAINAKIAGPPAIPTFTAALNPATNTITITDTLGNPMTVKILKDTTGEGNRLRVVNNNGNIFQRAWRWFRGWFFADSTVVVPAGQTASVSYDSPTGYKTRTLVADGVKTVADLQAELTGMLAADGYTFETRFVADPIDGDRWELVSQMMPLASTPTLGPGAFQIETTQGWSDWFGTMGVELTDQLPSGTNFCFGDGSGTACPCSNFSAQGQQSGCRNSLGLGGRLIATGNASIASDSLTLHGSNMPNSSVLYFQGTLAQNAGMGVPMGDGLVCAGGSVIRLGVKSNANGASQYPSQGDTRISVRGSVSAGMTTFYQAWYRDAPPGFCTPATFNLSNGVAAFWNP